MKIKIISFFVLIVLAALVAAYTTNEITAPATDYTTVSSDQVNISGRWNATATDLWVPGDFINVSILQKNSSTSGYKILSSHMVNLSNSTEPDWNQTVTLDEGYNWIKLNGTNMTTDRGTNFGSVTATRIINVDTDKFLLNIGGLGAINFTLDTGHIWMAGNLTIGGLNATAGYVCADANGKTYVSTVCP